LLLALARAVGIEGQPALVATAFHAPDRLLAPSAAYFDHMIACLDIGSELSWCVDPTAVDLPASLLPEAISDSVALSTIENEARLAQIASVSFAREMRVDSRNRISCEGQITETLERGYRGYLAARVRATLKPLTTEQQRAELVAAYREVVGEKAEPATTVRQLDDPFVPVVLETRTDFGTSVGPDATFYREPDVWLAFYLGQLTTRNRVHPYRFPGLDYRSHYTYELCPTWGVPYHGPTLDFASPWGTLHREYTIGENRVAVDTRVLLPRRLLVGEQRERMNAFLTRIAAESRIWFRLQRLPTE